MLIKMVRGIESVGCMTGLVDVKCCVVARRSWDEWC